MKKEKKVRTYQRRTKSGKTITVRAHTASYEAAEKAKEASKKKGAGDELSSKVKKGEEWKLPMDEFLKKLKEERAEKKWNDEVDKSWKSEDEKPKKKSEKKTEKKTPAKKTTKKRTVGTGTNGPEPKKKVTTKKTAAKADTSEPAFTRDEFKEWYRGTGSAADKKVAKALRKQLGSSGYRKFEDEAIDNYTSRGHLSMFKRVSGGSSASANTKSSAKENKVPKAKSEKKPVKGSLGITKSEFKAWYSDTDGSSASFKKVNRALKKFYGKDWDEVENRATFGGKTQYQDMLREIGSRFSTSPKTTAKATSKSKGSASTNSDEGSLKHPKPIVTRRLTTHEGQMSYIRSRVKELPEESRKRLNTFLRRASTGAISTTDLWRKYQREKYPKNKRQWSMPVPWDKRSWSDMAHSD